MALTLAFILSIWLAQSIYTIGPDQIGKELILGDPKQGLSRPGVHFMLWPIETLEVVNIHQRSHHGTEPVEALTTDDTLAPPHGDREAG